MSLGLPLALPACGFVLVAASILASSTRDAVAADSPLAPASEEAKRDLRARYPSEGARIDRGVDQVARRWRPEDGDAAAFRAFLAEEFAPSGPALDGVFDRFEF